MSEPPSSFVEATTAAETFFRRLYGDGLPDASIVVSFPVGERWRSLWTPSTDPAAAGRATVELSISESRFNVYASVALMDSRAQRPGTRGSEQAAAAIPGLWSDLDMVGPGHAGTDYPPDQPAALELLDELGIPPTLVVDSGGGLYPYWLFHELWALPGAEERQRARLACESLQGALRHVMEQHGWALDPTGDLARVLRIPGTTNWKYPRPVTVLRADGPRYGRAALAERLAGLPGGEKKHKERFDLGRARIPQGQRTASVASLAGHLLRLGVAEATAGAAATAHNQAVCDPLLDQTKVDATVAGIYRRYRAGSTLTDELAGRDWMNQLAAQLNGQDQGGTTATPVEEEPPDLDRPGAVDVTDWRAHASTSGEQEFVVRDLIPRGTIIVVTGEEGDGKTLLAEQLSRQLLRREPVLGFFEGGDVPISGVLFVDTEMSLDDTWPRWKDAEARGLGVEPGTFHWLNCGPLDLTSAGDHSYIAAELERTKANFLWVDAGGSAVSDPKEDLPVKAFFSWVLGLLRAGTIVAAGITLHPRKRAQGEYGRRFDDLFGSRDWKGKATKVLYIEGGKIVVWKDRGGHLGRRWPARQQGRFPLGVLQRPGLTDDASVPFVIEAKEPEFEFDADAAREMALRLVDERPGELTKSSLAERLGVRKGDGLVVVSGLLQEGLIGPDNARAKLYRQVDGAPGMPG